MCPLVNRPVPDTGARAAYSGSAGHHRLQQEDRIAAPCTRCGRTPADDDRFCGGCGSELVPPCARCGRPIAADAAFCTHCGTARVATAAGPVAADREDRRRVSVLFVDLIDFTPYVERADPELVRGMQTGFFTAARRVVGQYGGVVEKYIGDAVMALFGAPVATETDALRCVRAGLELQRVLARFTPAAPAATATACASGSASPPARRWSTSPPPATAGRRSWPATWSTPPPGCSRSRRRAACWSAAPPTR